MRYGIIVNPVCGTLSVDKKRKILDGASMVLQDCVIEGFDTKTREELKDCARELSNKAETLIVAGGDGTLSDIINSVDESTQLSLFPLGTGNAMKYTLGLPNRYIKIAEQIKNGSEHRLDLIDLHDRKAMLTSIGLEGCVLQERAGYLQQGLTGFNSYYRAVIRTLLDFKKFYAKVEIDGRAFEFPDCLSLIVTKSPFYGYGIKAVPKAKIDDGFLHLLVLNIGKTQLIYGFGLGIIRVNHNIGEYFRARNIQIETGREIAMQADGDLHNPQNRFEFSILPKALKMRY